jgi:peptidoglycan/LPS O-acetylase OafA/YrhL
MVIFSHAGDFYRTFPPILEKAFGFGRAVGWSGVDLFFVLSGFLVSGLLFHEHDKTGTLRIKRFLIRRAFKIVPAFYFLLLVTFIVNLTTGGDLKAVQFLRDILFIQNYGLGTWGHGWTLAIEVHFYILLALLLHLLARHSRRGTKWLSTLPWILGAVLVACFLARLVNSLLYNSGHLYNINNELHPSHLHLDVLAAGVLLRYLYNYHFESLAIFKRMRICWTVLGALLVTPSVLIYFPHPALVSALIPTCDYLGYGLILFQATQLPFPAAGPLYWLVKPFDYFGKHSYSIYLWHLPVEFWLVYGRFAHHGPTFVLVFLVTCLAVGTFFSEILEMPILRLRDWLFPSQASTTRAAGRLDPAAAA